MKNDKYLTRNEEIISNLLLETIYENTVPSRKERTENNLTQFLNKLLAKENITPQERENIILVFRELNKMPFHQLEYVYKNYNPKKINEITHGEKSYYEMTRNDTPISEIFKNPLEGEIVIFKYDNRLIKEETYAIFKKVEHGNKDTYLLRLLAINGYLVDEEDNLYTIEENNSCLKSSLYDCIIEKVENI